MTAGPLVAVVGPANCGKTTLFNAITGSRYGTANYPGATVEYALGRVTPGLGLEARVLDSPGLASLAAHSPDEAVSIRALFEEGETGRPDVVLVVADATQLSRHLLLAEQVRASGFRVVLAVTMLDLLAERGSSLDAGRLAELLGCPVVPVNPRTGDGLPALLAAAKDALGQPLAAAPRLVATGDETAIRASYARLEGIEREVVAGATGAEPHAPTVRLDHLLLHPVLGLAIFVLAMTTVFGSIFWLAQPAMDAVDAAFSWLGQGVGDALHGTWYGDLLANGLVAGAGSVLTFVPQIFILFVLLGLLEDSGYLARGAMLVDRPLSAIGLNGRSFVPMLSGFACAIPAIVAARTIPSRRERLLTIFVIPLMSCSARLPVYALLIAFVTPHRPWLGGLALAGLYFGSVVAGAVVATIAGRFLPRGGPSSFMLELPAYRRPVARFVLRTAWSRTRNYLRKAAVPIVVVAVVLWALAYFPAGGAVADDPHERVSRSLAASIGRLADPLMTPLGLDWRVAVALIAAFAAREVFVSALALVLRVTAEEDSLQGALLEAMRTATRADGTPLFTPASVAGLIVFFIFALQCAPTSVLARKESGSAKLAIAQFVAFGVTAWSLAALTVQGLRFLGVP